ncbi:MAG: ClpXP protease specificity-enhancing factor [Pseudomonadota bacterium]
MTPTRPYLVRAFYDWILDNGMTPYLLVDATVEGTFVPASYVREGRIVLNVAPAAVTDLHLGVAHVNFSARFGGIAQVIRLPVASIMAIYARENGQGMFFGNEDEETVDGPHSPDDRAPEPVRGRPALRVVK